MLILSIVNQVLFMLLYVVPLTNFSRQVKTGLFVVLILSAYLIYYIAHPKKISWLMSLVESDRRGRFTANKEMLSLVSGMVFSFAMGAVIDHFAGMGKTRVAFAISAGVIFVLMVLHSLTMLFTAEKPQPEPPKKNLKQAFGGLLKEKNVLRITALFLLYYISNYISAPFYAVYQIGELGFNLKFVSAITICGSASRILVSRFWGSYADKKSFATMIEKCFIFYGLSKLCVVFAVPATGKVMFALYYILHGIAMGGINSSLTNMIFRHISPEKSADALAFTQAAAGVTGFLTTLCISPLVAHIQQNGGIFGMPIYAQQLVSALALVFTVIATVYTRFAFIKKE